ncbi:Rieske (2Fe-2S) protein [Haladaptatus caseinilyticus]|uniref:Rieske (2Fe-2S) protein n=1 Tax=Haladaptatus caseinilyticus TaxID=2993314 RepID=UPI00224B4CEF|nr:Rieske 2Fe-2S domain-containing protein [Haladaptatus caseinilyticus]
MVATDATRLTTVDELPENGSFLFTIRERDGSEVEVILVNGGDCISAWRNFCQHETDQRLDRGFGAVMRDGEIVCPKHGSMFDACSGHCDNGKAKGSTLLSVDVTVEDDDIYLTDRTCDFLHEGGIEDEDDDDDGMPSSSSHLTF